MGTFATFVIGLVLIVMVVGFLGLLAVAHGRTAQVTREKREREENLERKWEEEAYQRQEKNRAIYEETHKKELDLWRGRELLAERTRLAQIQAETEGKRRWLLLHAQEAQRNGRIVCPKCLDNNHLTIDSEPCHRCGGCKGLGCNGDAGSQCQSCEAYDEEQRRNNDD